jgi:hypothetical protein
MQIADAVQKVLDTIKPPHQPAVLAIDDDSEPSEAGAGTVRSSSTRQRAFPIAERTSE